MSNHNNTRLRPRDAAAIVERGLASRRASERRFKFFGRLAIGIALAFLVILFCVHFFKGIPGFFQYYVTLEVQLDRGRLDPAGDLSVQSLYDGDARGVIREALYETVGASGRSQKRAAGKIVSVGAEQRLRKAVLAILIFLAPANLSPLLLMMMSTPSCGVYLARDTAGRTAHR